MENSKKKTTVDSLWQELASLSQPQPKLKSTGSIFEAPLPFGASIKQISFRRHHPMEPSIGHNEPDMTMDDWTRPHD